MGGIYKGSARNQLITRCKTCRSGIFVGQPAVWQRTPLLGLVHRDCVTGAHVGDIDTTQVHVPPPADDD
ncbi:MAG: hypothetical protein M3N52_11915 [Actinomycetota bacterium]|nr:hypothetical protein [Actinomycetota bacterium]